MERLPAISVSRFQEFLEGFPSFSVDSLVPALMIFVIIGEECSFDFANILASIENEKLFGKVLTMIKDSLSKGNKPKSILDNISESLRDPTFRISLGSAISTPELKHEECVAVS